jgi:thioredoxin reductase
VGKKAPIPLDVAVVGGGPAGVSACLELFKHGQLKIGLFESDSEIGGMPRSCHIFFGMRDMKRIYTGPAYARKLDRLIQKTSVDIHTNATVLKIIPGSQNGSHRLAVSSPEGVKEYDSRSILLATGCYERSRESRRIPGARSAGVFTTGALEQFTNLQHLKPGNAAVVIGSEAVAFSSVLTLQRGGVSIVGLVDEDDYLKTYPVPAKIMSRVWGFPIYHGYKVASIFGKKRVEGVELVSTGDNKPFKLECDTVICTGSFHPAASLIFGTAIEEDPLTSGPTVDLNLMTTVPKIFAAGNILHGAYMHDICALEGKQAAYSILRGLKEARIEREEAIRITVEPPIRYVVPQILLKSKLKRHRASLFTPGVSVQLASTVKKSIIEAWSGKEKIWEGSYSRFIGCSRIPIPIEKFEWSRVDPRESIRLRVRGD